MANKIVIIKKGEVQGIEFPLDLDTGTNGNGIAYRGNGHFLIGVGNKLTLYHLDTAAGVARRLRSGGLGQTVQGIYDLRNGNILAIVGTSASSPAVRLVSLVNGQTILTRSLGGLINPFDISYDGDVVLFSTQQSSVPTPNARIRTVKFSTNLANIIDLDSGTTAMRFMDFALEGNGIWFSAGNNVRLIDFAGNIKASYTLTHAGTIKRGQDCGPFFAFLYN